MTRDQTTLERDHISRMYDICELAKVGIAATDSCRNTPHLTASLCVLLEYIDLLAGEAVDIAEKAERKAGEEKAA